MEAVVDPTAPTGVGGFPLSGSRGFPPTYKSSWSFLYGNMSSGGRLPCDGGGGCNEGVLCGGGGTRGFRERLCR